LAAHPDVTPEEQRNAGGCKSGYNMDQYTRMNPKLRMTAANGLAGHKNAQKMVYPPSLGSLVGLIDGNCLNRLELKLHLYWWLNLSPVDHSSHFFRCVLPNSLWSTPGW
jgi:hypothetical protein